MDPTLAKLVDRFNLRGGSTWMKAPKLTKDAISAYTQLYLNDDGRSCHHKDDADHGRIVYKVCPVAFDVKTIKDDDGNKSFVIEGWASTGDQDLDDEIIVPGAFESSLKSFVEKGRMLFMHDWWKQPVGKWLTGEIKDKGLWVSGIVADTTDGLDIQKLIELEALDSLSVGFRVIKDEYDYDEDIRTIVDLELLEVSIVNIPANPNAVFEMAKANNLKSLISNRPVGPNGRKGNTMDPELVKLITQLSENYDVSAGPVGDRLAKMDQTMASVQGILKAVREEAAKMHDPADTATKSDLLQFMDNTKDDMTALTDEMKTLQAAHKAASIDKMVVTDWRGMLDNIHLRDENGKALPAEYQKAYRILNLPIDYDKSSEGSLVKAARNLNDVCLVMDCYYRHSAVKGARYGGMQTLPAFQKLAELMGVLDPELGAGMKAMYTGGAGVGLEWIPTLWSGEWDTLYRLRPTLVNFLRPVWQMPSATAKWPILAGAGLAYLADEAADNNPKVLTKSNLTTAVVTFTARTIATAIPVSKQLLEDSIVDIAMVIREELVIALAEAEEDADINGDNSANHFDTGRSLESGDDDVKVAWKGLRKIATDTSNTWDMQSASLGDGTTAFTALDVRYNRQLLSILGLNPSECLHVGSIGAYYQALSFSQVTKANEFGFASTWLSGTLPALDGVEIYISSHLGENLNASGIFDDVTTDNTGWLTLHKRSFMPGEKRGVQLEFDLNIDTQQWLFVSTMRRDFQNMRPTTQKPVAWGYNIDN